MKRAFSIFILGLLLSDPNSVFASSLVFNFTFTGTDPFSGNTQVNGLVTGQLSFATTGSNVQPTSIKILSAPSIYGYDGLTFDASTYEYVYGGFNVTESSITNPSYLAGRETGSFGFEFQFYDNRALIYKRINPTTTMYSTADADGSSLVLTPSAIPEPSAYALTGLGLAFLIFLLRRKPIIQSPPSE